MPLPTVLFLAFGTGLVAAVAGAHELRVSPRSALLSRTFFGYAIFACVLLAPTSAYFYVFHGDWFLLYLVDSESIPSAVALIGFAGQVGLGALGFSAGASLVRNQRGMLAILLGAVSIGAAAGVPFLLRERLGRVGTYMQFAGDFGLTPYAEGPLLPGAVVMGALTAGGCVYLVVRLRQAGPAG